MNERKKILIAIDDSEYSEHALADLPRAGLPRHADAVVLSVTDHWLPAPADFNVAGIDLQTGGFDEEKRSLATARLAATRLRTLFPDWTLHAETAMGSAASVIVQKADLWRPDLVVVGSHGRSAVGRFFLGSVSQSVLHHARCGVRIARAAERTDRPPRLIVGVDGSKWAAAAVAEIAGRNWPRETGVRIVNAAWTIPPSVSNQMIGQVGAWMKKENERIRKMIEDAAIRLMDAGLIVTTTLEQEEPRKLLLQEAESYEADCLFLGARGMGAVERLMLGSVSSTVAARAHCSVEVIRRPEHDEGG